MNSHARAVRPFGFAQVKHRAQHGFCILLALVLLGLYAIVALAYLVGDGLQTVVQRCGRSLQWLDRWSIRGL